MKQKVNPEGTEFG